MLHMLMPLLREGEMRNVACRREYTKYDVQHTLEMYYTYTNALLRTFRLYSEDALNIY